MSTPGECFVGLTDLKSFLGVTGSSDDDLITSIRDDSVSVIEDYCRRIFGIQDINVKIDIRQFQDTLMLKYYPVIQGSVALTDDGSGLTEDTNYYVKYSSGVIKLMDSSNYDYEYFKEGRQKTEVSYISGFLAIPGSLKLAIKKICSRLYNNRDSLTSEKIGTYGYSIKVNDSGLTGEEELMLNPHRKIGGFSNNV